MSRNISTGCHTISDQEMRQNSTLKGKLLFTVQRGRMCALLIQNDRLTAAQVLAGNACQIGAIYIGKVKNVVKNIDACFVEIAGEELCFLPLKEAQAPMLLNRKFDGRILEGDEILVQVTRDAQKTKQPSVTANVSLSNEAFVISLGNLRMGYSNKLSKEDKSRIQDYLNTADIRLPSTGMVVRTQAGKLSNEEMKAAYESLATDWVNMMQAAATRTCFTCLKEPARPFEAILDQMVYPEEYDEILTDSQELYEEISEYVTVHHPDKAVRFYSDTSFTLSKLYSLDAKRDTALNTRVWRKSGGYLVIEHTEALTVIDVNSGKFSAKKDASDTYLRINREAAEEIALQLRLRNLSGIIIVDFINMTSAEKQEELLNYLRTLVRKDKQKTTVVDITPLGLVEITRKKTNKTLQEQFK